LAVREGGVEAPRRLIGVIEPDSGGRSSVVGWHKIGCAGRVTQFSEAEDGRYMVTLSGASRFRVLSEVEGFTPYRRAQISWDGFEQDFATSDSDPGFKRDRFMALLARYFESRDLSTDWDSLKEADDELLINSLSMLLGFEPEDKQALLEAPSLTTRRETLVTLIEYALRGGEDKEMMQ